MHAFGYDEYYCGCCILIIHLNSRGADIAALVHEAGIIAMQESISGNNTSGCHRVTMRHFQNAARRIRPSVPEKDRIVYQKLKKMYGKLKLF